MSKYLKAKDMVKVITGDDKGKSGKILAYDRKTDRIKVEGINIQTSFNKETRKGITKSESWIHVSNVQYLEGENTTGLRRNKEGVRVSKKTQKEIDEPK